MSAAVVPENHVLAEKSAVEGPFGGKPIKEWGNDLVVQWVVNIGFQDCSEVFQAHLVTGRGLPRLTPPLLAEMGIASVGRRILLMSEITKLQAVDRAHWRNELLWQGVQYRSGPCNGVLPYNFPLCCEMFVGKPDVYKFTNSRFTMTRWTKNVNYPCCGCCGHTMESISQTLADIKDIDLGASTALVGDPPGQLMMSTVDGGMFELTLKSSECQKVCAMVTNAKEEAAIQMGLMQYGRA